MYDSYMIAIPYRIAFILLYFIIQLLWTVTSRGKNLERFTHTWRNLNISRVFPFMIFGFAQIVSPNYLGMPFWSSSHPLWEILGLGTSVAGVIVASWAKIVMGTSWGRPAQHDKSIQSNLITSGPFAYSRNPIYVGLFLLLLGQEIALMSYGVIVVVLFALVLRHTVHVEEILLEEAFGNSYREYKKHTSRFVGLPK